MKGKSLYIFSADCKDLILPQYYSSWRRKKTGHSMLNSKRDYNLRRFGAALDYSLDQIHLSEVYEQIYGDMDFSFRRRRKQYTTHVVNVTFKYAVREYNNVGGGLYVKLGYCPRDVQLSDGICSKDGELIAVQTDQELPYTNGIGVMLEPYFAYQDGKYCVIKQPKVRVTTSEARKRLYENGFWCDGVHYIRWKRSSGSARVGKCLFINEALYPAMHQWELCGLNIRDGDEVDLAALESYVSLPTSSIIDLLDLAPDNILVIDDYESVFEDDVVSVEEHDGKLTAERKKCEIRNSIWDGQGLIDKSAMGPYGDKGMVLLRNLFFKCCCFNCNLQQWFSDHGITEISQLRGRTKAQRIEDIKLVTTPSSIKYLKFGTLDDWLAHVEPQFGVVKYDKTTHFFDGRMVQIHYQLLNTLHMTKEDVDELLAPTFHYMDLIRTDPAVLRYHIHFPIDDDGLNEILPAQSKNDIVFKMLGINDRFAETKLYYDFRSDVMKSMTKNLRIGHVLVNGNYSVLCGNPIEMLLAITGEFDGTSQIGVGNIHSTRFSYGRRLLGSRSPHITCSNVWTPMNVENELIDHYMNPTPEILYLNSINDNVLNRLSGCDFDSDTVLLTDNDVLIDAALRSDGEFPIAMANVPAVKRKRHYTRAQQCDLDIKTSRNKIGETINLSQECNSMMWNRLNAGESRQDVAELYEDICILNVMSSLFIDAAKKEFNIDLTKELRLLSKKYERYADDGRKIKPNFFAAKDRGKGYYDSTKRLYDKHNTTMDYLQTAINSYRSRKGKQHQKHDFLPFAEIVTREGYDHRSVWRSKIDRAVNLVRQSRNDINAIYMDDSLPYEEQVTQAKFRRQDCIEYVGEIEMSRNTMIYFLKHLEEEEFQDVRRHVFNTLFGYPNTAFYDLILHSALPVPMLVEDPGGEIQLFGLRYAKDYKKQPNHTTL